MDLSGWIGSLVALVVFVLLLLGALALIAGAVVSGTRSARTHHGASLRTGVAGSMYDWLNQDKQKAIEIIIEEKAEARRPEYPDGNLPDLDSPVNPRPGQKPE